MRRGELLEEADRYGVEVGPVQVKLESMGEVKGLVLLGREDKMSTILSRTWQPVGLGR